MYILGRKEVFVFYFSQASFYSSFTPRFRQSTLRVLEKTGGRAMLPEALAKRKKATFFSEGLVYGGPVALTLANLASLDGRHSPGRSARLPDLGLRSRFGEIMRATGRGLTPISSGFRTLAL